MGSLDELVERKDIDAWTRRREAKLRASVGATLESTPPEKRELALQKVRGRIAEVRRFRKLVNEKGFRAESKRLQSSLVRTGDWPPEAP